MDEKEWSGPFTFVLITDPQFGFIEKYLECKLNPNCESEMSLANKAIQKINQMNPKPLFVIIDGDMLDTPPKTKETIKTRQDQYNDFLSVFQNLDKDIKLICVCGNHDACDIPTKESLEIYQRQFGLDFFSFWVGGVKFTVLNSQLFKNPHFVQDHAKRQEEFMETIKETERNPKHNVIFQHIPFFIANVDEVSIDYLNIEQGMRKTLLDKYKSWGVGYIFCGHLHRNAGGIYKGISQVVTAAMGGSFAAIPGYRVVRVEEDHIWHEYVPINSDHKICACPCACCKLN